MVNTGSRNPRTGRRGLERDSVLAVERREGQLRRGLQPIVGRVDGVGLFQHVERVGVARRRRQVLLALVHHLAVDQHATTCPSSGSRDFVKTPNSLRN